MADVRCPQCNTLNPGDAVECWNCQHTLKPDESTPPHDSSFDWLSDLRDGSDDADWSQGAEPAAQENADEDVPEWLDRIRRRSQVENEGEEDDGTGEASPAEELPDWLKDLSSQPLEEGAGWPPAPAPSEEDTIPPSFGQNQADDDWFTSFTSMQSRQAEDSRTNAGQFQEEESQAGRESTQPGSDDWLGGQPFNFDSDTPETTAPDRPAFDAEIPDWLREQAPEAADPAPDQPHPDAALIDWLLEPEETQPETPAAGEPAAPAMDNIFTEWGEQEPTSPAFEADVPDFSMESEGPATGQPDAEPEAATGEFPDWLSMESGAQAFELPEQPAAESDLQNWLDTQGEPAAAGLVDEEPAEAGELPTWLFTAGEQESQPLEEAGPSLEPLAEADGLDWLQDLKPETGLTQSDEEQPAGQEPFTPRAEDLSENPGEEAGEDIATSAFEVDELPDWLSETTVDLPAQTPPASTPAFILDEGEELEEPEEAAIEPANPFVGAGIPGWLDDEAEAEVEEPQPEAQGDDLTRAHLPSWLEAMRPVETVALGGSAAAGAGSEEPLIEKSGPLAGITGILPAEGLALEYGHPPTYSMRLRVSDKQRASAALLETVLEEENKPQEIRRESAGAPQAIVRLLVGILLIAVIVLSGGLSGVSNQFGAAPTYEMVSFNNQMETMPSDAAVLVAVEFDPAYSGEMNLVGRDVVRQLIDRGNRLVLISTTPTGPVLGEELLAQSSSNGGLPGTRFINLGYLAGGVVSLQEFAGSPQSAARYGMDWVRTGQQAWQHPALEGVQAVTDFGMVLVLTDSGDTARMWIEQVAPHLGPVPMMMVTTAQAAPILQPYLTGGQIDGLISGLTGSMAYSRLNRGAADLEGTWLAFRAGLLVAIVLVLIGIFFQVVNSLISRPKA